MFTGLVEELGRVEEVDAGGNRMRIRGEKVTGDAAFGDSIAVNGVCLTVTELDGGIFAIDVMAETLSRSALGALGVGDGVNLERAARVDSRLGGHIVQGHVDGTAELVQRRDDDGWQVFRFSLPRDLEGYVVEKGSITVSGVSLTVSAVSPVSPVSPELTQDADDPGWFEVSLIPTTLDETTLGSLSEGDPVNLEVDVLAKYAERLLEVHLSRGPGTSP